MDLNTKITWPLYKKYGHACKAFRLAVSDPAAIFGDLDIDEEVLSKLTLNINRRLTPQAIKIRADIEVTCFEYSGIEAIIEALNAGLAHSTKQSKLKIKLIAPPLYVVLAQSMDKAAGIKQMTEAINAIQEVITKHGGNLNIKMAPKATSQREDTELNKLMETLEMQNQEVDGDDQDAKVE
jgi:translation initiation factor 2 subunit 1